MKVYTNESGVYEGDVAVVEHSDKDRAAGLEIAESFILCGHQAFKTHIKNIAVFMHEDDRVQVAQGQFTDKGNDVDLTRLELEMFLFRILVRECARTL
jgi:hypothetical protein